MLSSKKEEMRGFQHTIGKTLSFMSPNSWTILSFFLAIGSAYFLASRELIGGAILFAIAAFCDAVDGAVARYTGNAGKKGAYIDTIIDRYVEFFIIFGLLFANMPNFILPANAWLLIYMFGALMTTYSKAAAKEKEIISKELRFGFIERAERLIILFIGIIAGSINLIYLVYVIAALSVLVHISAIMRIKKIMQVQL